MTEANAAANAGTETADTATQTASNEAWYSSMDEESQNWIAAKGWKKDNAAEVIGPALTSYRNAEQLISKIKGDPDRILVMPKDFNNADEVRSFYDKLGVPKDVGGYEIKPVGDETVLDSVVSKVAETALKHGVSKTAMQAIVNDYRAEVGKIMEDRAVETKQSLDRQFEEFEQESGADFERNRSYAAEAIKTFPELEGIAQEIEKIPGGAKIYLQHMVNIGKRLGEHRSVGVGEQEAGGGMSREAATAALGQFQMDSNKQAALLNPNHPAHKATMAEFQRLHAQAAGGV